MSRGRESGSRALSPGLVVGLTLSSVLLVGCSTDEPRRRSGDEPARPAAACGVEAVLPNGALLDAGDIWRPLGRVERSTTLIEYRPKDCQERPTASLDTAACDQFPWSADGDDLYSLGVRKLATASFRRTDQAGAVSQVKEQVLVQKAGSDLGDVYRDGAKRCGGSVLAAVNGKASTVLITGEGKRRLLVIDEIRVVSIEATQLDVTALTALEDPAVRKATKLG